MLGMSLLGYLLCLESLLGMRAGPSEGSNYAEPSC